MTKEEMREIKPGTKLLVADDFTIGIDEDVRKYLGSIITFKNFDGLWVYFEEPNGGDSPFHHTEIVGIAIECLNDNPYEVGSIQALLS